MIQKFPMCVILFVTLMQLCSDLIVVATQDVSALLPATAVDHG